MPRLRVVGCLIVVVLGCATAVALGASPTVPLITVALPRSDAAVPFALALRQDMFKAAGLDVQLVFVTSTAQAIAEVDRGQAEFGVGDPASVMAYATVKPAALELVSGVTTTKRGFTALLATGAVDDAAATYGGKVGVPELDGLDRVAAQVWLDENGSDTNSVTFVQVASQNARRALARGYADAVLVDQPELFELAGTPGIRSLGDVENGLLGSDAPAAAAFATTGYLRSSAGHAAAVRFDAALRRALAYTAAHRSQAASLLTSLAGWPPALTARLTPAYSATLDTFVLEQIAEAQYAYELTGAGQPDVAALVWSRAPQQGGY